MKSPERPPKKTSDTRSNSPKKYTKKSFDAPRFSKSSDAKFKKTDSGEDKKKMSFPDKKRFSDTRFSDNKSKKSWDTEKGSWDRHPDRNPDNRKRDDKRFLDKKPYRSGDAKKNENKRPIEKYVDTRKRDFDDRRLSGSDKRKRPRVMEPKTYQGRIHEYRETKILFKDNTYEKRLSINPGSNEDGIRLNKFIANAGICSRREADSLIEAGAISINGNIITQLGTRVMPHDEVKYGDQLLCGEPLQYLLLNKPKGYLTTTDDPQERKTVMMIVDKACKERIYPVGRLDKNTSGLLLFTNDGELAKKLTHPKHMVEKIYHAELDKNLTMADMKKIAAGIELDDGFIKVDAIAYGETKKEVGIELHSGKNRIVRRIFESLGYDVMKLDRVVFAGLTKKDLPRGKYRFLSAEEVNILRRIR